MDLVATLLDGVDLQAAAAAAGETRPLTNAPVGAPRSIIDSGTSMLDLRAPIHEAVVARAAATLAADGVALPVHWFGGSESGDGNPCAGTSLTAAAIAKLPSLTLVLAGANGGDDVELEIPPCRFVTWSPAWACPAGTGGAEGGFIWQLEAADEGGDTIIGQVLHEQYYVAHDIGVHPSVGFAPIAGCGAISPCGGAAGVVAAAAPPATYWAGATPLGAALLMAAGSLVVGQLAIRIRRSRTGRGGDAGTPGRSWSSARAAYVNIPSGGAVIAPFESQREIQP